MYGCESWTVKKAEHWRIDAVELWCWRRLLRIPWTARRSNQSILKEISLGCSLKGMMLKLKLQYLATSCEELTHWKRLWCWDGLGAGDKGTREDEMAGWHYWFDRHEFEWTLGDGDGQGGLACCNSWGRRVGHDWMTELNWTKLNDNFWIKSATISAVGTIKCWMPYFKKRKRKFYPRWLEIKLPKKKKKKKKNQVIKEVRL